MLVDRELESDAPFDAERCGACTRCLEACPTGAIVAPGQVDARRCISYLTIEHPGPIPPALRPLVGDWVFGCDLCQEVCPWNRFAPPAREARLHALPFEGWTLERFLTLDEPGFRALFAASAIRRAGRGGFLRNVCVALGNRGDAAAVPALARAPTPTPTRWCASTPRGRWRRSTADRARPTPAESASWRRRTRRMDCGFGTKLLRILQRACELMV